MARTPPNVTGAGAKYVAAGRKQREASQVAAAAKQFTNIRPTLKPAPGAGLAHALQPNQFKVNRPASTPRNFNPSSSMHPGGAGMAAASIKSSRMGTTPHPGGYAAGGKSAPMGNVTPGASMKPQRLKGPIPAPAPMPQAKASAPSGNAFNTTSGKPRGNPVAPGGAMQRKLGMRFGRQARQAATQAAGRGKMPGKGNVIGRGRMLHFNASRQAGKNAVNLRSMTKAP